MCSRVCHWGPLVAIGIVVWISLATVFSNTMVWPPMKSWGGMANMIGFLASSCLTTFHFFCAMCDGPGYLPKNWRPENSSDEEYLQYCDTCQGYKAPRSHHCRKCGHCIMKMDHHCPWINNCVGHFNHGHFVGFLFFAVLGCAQATVILAMTLYYGLNRSWYRYYGSGREPDVILTIWSLLIVMFALGLAIGVVLAVGALLYFQVRAIWRNQTGIEDWIIEKADYRRRDTKETFLHPYHLGRWKNLRFVLTATCMPNGDGIDWPLREGTFKYDLTIEQLEQKADKRQRTREYKIMRPYSGSWFPLWGQGFRVAFHPPCTDEPRISLSKDDIVKVTRWKKHWLYGDKVLQDTSNHFNAEHARSQQPLGEHKNSRLKPSLIAGQRQRGWFPRQCAFEVVANDHSYEDCKTKSIKKTRSKESNDFKSRPLINGEGKKDK